MTYFRDEGHFDSLPWTVYFHLGVAFIAQSTLQVDKYSNCKKQRFLDQYGDMRHQMAFQILSLWSHLGSLRLHFIPGKICLLLYNPFLTLFTTHLLLLLPKYVLKVTFSLEIEAEERQQLFK